MTRPGLVKPPWTAHVGGETGAVEPDLGSAGVVVAAAAGAPVVRAGAVTAAAPHVGHAQGREPGGQALRDAGGRRLDGFPGHRRRDRRVVRDGDIGPFT